MNMAIQMEKETFLERLETALKKLVCDRLYSDADHNERRELAAEVDEFIRENVSHYSSDELVETFTSAENAIALFLEYQDAKRLVRKE
jgi:hypothetical protein